MWICHATIILSLLWIESTSTEPTGYIIQLKRDVSVEEGLCVTIPCSFTTNYRTTYTKSTGYWKKRVSDDIVASNDKSVTGVKPNFQLTGNPDIRDCTLTITSARREDNGEYYFRFEETTHSSNKCNYVTNTTILTVRDLTREPEISNPGPLISGREVTLTCSPPGNCSGAFPVFQWTKSNQIGIWKKTANVTFTPSQSDHRQSITCNVTFPAVNSSTQRTINLDVHYTTIGHRNEACNSPIPGADHPSEYGIQYPPRNPDVLITSSKGRKLEASVSVSINEGESLTLNCTVDSNPAATVRWTKGEVDVDLNDTTGLEVVNITSSEADTYRCFAWNIYGVTEKRIHVINEQGVDSTIRDLMIGIMCVIVMVLAVLLMIKIIANKQMSKNPKSDPIEAPPTDEPSQLYMNIRKFKQRSKVQKPSMRVDISSITTDQDEELHYSNISFPAEPSGTSLSQPGVEYAKIKPKRIN
ncbi:sialic acid-binding Ig-like lectin 13 isoform X2 [Pseudophryne corroboree]|uniref:sialic acid-binding Ig-like lectin 13 isoform X2 n=1 Tax=Pseudophryne corroboree TaxID=495146 RepID=UPI0030812081